MEYTEILNALNFKYKSKLWVLYESSGYEGMLWHSNDVPKPSLDDLKKAYLEYHQNEKNTEHLRLRASEYPTESEKQTALWESMVNGNQKPLTELKRRMEEVDLKYPPPNQ